MPAQLSIGVLTRERPPDGSAFAVAIELPSVDFGCERIASVNATIETPASERADLDLGHVQPTGVLRGAGFNQRIELTCAGNCSVLRRFRTCRLLKRGAAIIKLALFPRNRNRSVVNINHYRTRQNSDSVVVNTPLTVTVRISRAHAL